MNEQPTFSKIILSYLIIAIITGVVITTCGTGRTFADNTLYANSEQDGIAKSLSVERTQEQAAIDTAASRKHPVEQHDYHAELRNHIWTISELRARIDEVNERIQQLTDSMPNPPGRRKLADQQQTSAIGNESVIEMIEPTSVSTSDTLVIASTEADISSVEGTVKHSAKKKDTTSPDKRDSVNNSAKSPWVVNLVSLSNMDAADRFAARARSKDVQVERYVVTIKGKQYWRVYASGFSTAAEAKFQANKIKEKLGLKDAWIAKLQIS